MPADLLSLAGPVVDRPGAFSRSPTRFHGSLEPNAGPGRYHLFASLACPWAHRTLIVRRLRGLEGTIGTTIVGPIRDERGWRFVEPDEHTGFSYLAEAYTATDPGYDGRISTPVLWDLTDRRIVNNESSEVIVQLNDLGAGPDLYPVGLRSEIDRVNEIVYANVNNGVYRCGFARSQEAYDDAFDRLFATLDALEERLVGQRYLVGTQLTLADIRLFTTLVRFDSAYHGHFKCNLRRLVDYAALWAYTRDLYQRAGFRDTVDLDQIKHHYYLTHPHIDPSGIVPGGPELDLDEPHGRDGLA
jgi:putative glutathione S-transferase